VPEQRPIIKNVYQQLLNDYVCVAPLSVSQSSVSDMLTVEALLGVSSGIVQSTDKTYFFGIVNSQQIIANDKQWSNYSRAVH
jgi:hypothetical protein